MHSLGTHSMVKFELVSLLEIGDRAIPALSRDLCSTYRLDSRGSAKHNFKRLDVWSRSIDLASDVYRLTEYYPSSEKFGLISQTRRCAISIPSNRAEGCGRNTNRQLVHFCSISRASTFELETQVILAERLKYLNHSDARHLTQKLVEIQKMLDGLIQSLNNTMENT